MLKEGYQNLKSTLGLAWQLAKANFKLRNEGSYLGILWYLLYPLALFFILSIIKGALYKSSTINFYPAYLMLGLIIFNFFSGAIGNSITIMGNNKNFIKSGNLNKFSLVLSVVLLSIFSHLFELVILGTLFIILGLPLWSLALYIPIFLLLCLFIIGISFIFSILGSYISDLKNIWTILSGILLFITPIAFVVEKNTALHWVNQLNPLYYFITFARESIIYLKIPELSIIIGSLALSLVTLGLGFIILKRYQNKLAEVL
jgi:ABC-type polysaccharide/polyol phosphate export permease